MRRSCFFGLVLLLTVLVLVVPIIPCLHCSTAAAEIKLRMGIMMDIPSLDPKERTNNWECVVTNNIYDGLIYPGDNPGKLYVPWLAESWEVSADGKTYTFRLRKGVKFHDGTEVTAEDVAFSMDRMIALGGAMSTHFTDDLGVGDTKVVDKYTVAFHLKNPDPSFLASQFVFKIVNKKEVLTNKAPGKFGEFGDYGAAWLASHEAGSGPYKVVENAPQDHVTLEKFNDYSLRKWQKGSVDKVVFLVTPEIATITAMMKKGEIDIADWTLPPQIMKDLDDTKGIRVVNYPSGTNWFIIINNQKPPLDDVNVRKAVAYAFDYDTVIKDILAGGVRAKGPVPNHLPGHNDDLLVYTRDLNKAKELIGKSKYSKEELAKFELDLAAVAGSERFQSIGLLAATCFKEIGLNVQVKPVRWADICQNQVKPETAFPFVIFYEESEIPHPQMFLVFFTKEMWGTAYPPGGLYYENPRVTELIKEAKRTPSPEKQADLYKKAQALIVDDSPCLFMHNGVREQALWEYIKGYTAPAGSCYYELRFDKFTVDTTDDLYKRNQELRK